MTIKKSYFFKRSTMDQRNSMKKIDNIPLLPIISVLQSDVMIVHKDHRHRVSWKKIENGVYKFCQWKMDKEGKKTGLGSG